MLQVNTLYRRLRLGSWGSSVLKWSEFAVFLAIGFTFIVTVAITIAAAVGVAILRSRRDRYDVGGVFLIIMV